MSQTLAGPSGRRDPQPLRQVSRLLAGPAAPIAGEQVLTGTGSRAIIGRVKLTCWDEVACRQAGDQVSW